MENKFEKVLWSVRYVVILAVILSIVASISLIVIGSWDIIQAIIFYNPLFDSAIQDNNQLLFKIISSIDLFLIGIVLLGLISYLLIAFVIKAFKISDIKLKY